MRLDRLMPPLRDLVCLALGSYGFAYQVTHGADWVLMVGCIVMLSGPAVMATWALRGSTPASGSSPPSPEPPPSLPSPSPSPCGGGDR